LKDLSVVASNLASYTIDGVQYSVPVQLLPIIAGNASAWKRFYLERSLSRTFTDYATRISLPFIDAQSMSKLWDVLIPQTYVRRIPGLSSIVAQLDGHVPSAEYFIAFLLGRNLNLNNADVPLASGMTQESLITDVHARLEELACSSDASGLLEAFHESILSLKNRYGNFESAGSELLAAVVSHCPVRMDDVLDGTMVESLLSGLPLAFTSHPNPLYGNTLFYLSMPLSLLTTRAAELDSPLSRHLSSVMSCQCMLGKQVSLEEAFARQFALLLAAIQLLPSNLRKQAISKHFPRALLLAGADAVTGTLTQAVTADVTTINVHHCTAKSPVTAGPRGPGTERNRTLAPGLEAGTSVVVNAPGAPLAGVVALTSEWRVWVVCLGPDVKEVTSQLIVNEVSQLEAQVSVARKVDTVASHRTRRDVVVVVSQGRGVDLSIYTCKQPSMPCIVLCRGHGFEEFFHLFTDLLK
jgi:hypothetical protein